MALRRQADAQRIAYLRVVMARDELLRVTSPMYGGAAASEKRRCRARDAAVAELETANAAYHAR